MIEGFILRAGNQADVHERICAAYIGGLVSEAKADMLSKLVSVNDYNPSQGLSTVAWGQFCPFSRDRFKELHSQILTQVKFCLMDHAVLYEKLLHREIADSGFSGNVELTVWGKQTVLDFYAISIEGKNLEDHIAESINAIGRRVLSACESTVVNHFSINEFIARVGGLLDSEMDNLRTLVESIFTSYAAHWIRKINTQFTESLVQESY